jgi:hypothetical protein
MHLDFVRHLMKMTFKLARTYHQMHGQELERTRTFCWRKWPSTSDLNNRERCDNVHHPAHATGKTPKI